MSTTKQFAVGDEFLNNDGKGPLRAKINSIHGETVYMEMWNTMNPRPTRRSRKFELSLWYLGHKACGWVKQ